MQKVLVVNNLVSILVDNGLASALLGDDPQMLKQNVKDQQMLKQGVNNHQILKQKIKKYQMLKPEVSGLQKV